MLRRSTRTGVVAVSRDESGSETCHVECASERCDWDDDVAGRLYAGGDFRDVELPQGMPLDCPDCGNPSFYVDGQEVWTDV
jgi:hypothetical protein